jgi:hypothetical protein
MDSKIVKKHYKTIEKFEEEMNSIKQRRDDLLN